jgi:phosphonoacetate hydrolase
MTAIAHATSIKANGRTYGWPVRPTVVVCFDGCDPAYIAASGSAGHIPTISRFLQDGFSAVADAAMPTFTNPNNV